VNQRLINSLTELKFHVPLDTKIDHDLKIQLYNPMQKHVVFKRFVLCLVQAPLIRVVVDMLHNKLCNKAANLTSGVWT